MKRSRAVAESSSESSSNGFQEDVNMDDWPQSPGLSPKMLLQEFQSLSVKELMEASRVCSKWREIAEHPSLWKIIRITYTTDLNFKGMAKMLQKHRSVHLDLTKMWYSGINDGVWQNFVMEIRTVNSVKKIEMGRFPAFVIQQLLKYNRKLEVLNAVEIIGKNLNIAPISSFLNLQELRLKSFYADLTLTPRLTILSQLRNMKHLSLTSISNLRDLQVNAIGDLLNLESLELGDCVNLPDTFGSEVLSKLKKLEKLRLIECEGYRFTFGILESIKSMRQLTQLELINFEIVYIGFDLALGECKYIKKLLIIPNSYLNAMSNFMIFGGVLRLWSSLTQFDWGITNESLKKRARYYHKSTDVLPIQTPLPRLKQGRVVEGPEGPRKVDVILISNFQYLLSQSLPLTCVRILKIPADLVSEQRIGNEVN